MAVPEHVINLSRIGFIVLIVLFSILSFKFHKLTKNYMNGSKSIRAALSWLFGWIVIALFVGLFQTFYEIECSYLLYMVPPILLVGVIPFFKEVN